MVLHTRSGSMDTTIDGASGLLKEKEQLLRSVAKGFAEREELVEWWSGGVEGASDGADAAG